MWRWKTTIANKVKEGTGGGVAVLCSLNLTFSKLWNHYRLGTALFSPLIRYLQRAFGSIYLSILVRQRWYQCHLHPPPALHWASAGPAAPAPTHSTPSLLLSLFTERAVLLTLSEPYFLILLSIQWLVFALIINVSEGAKFLLWNFVTS